MYEIKRVDRAGGMNPKKGGFYENGSITRFLAGIHYTDYPPVEWWNSNRDIG